LQNITEGTGSSGQDGDAVIAAGEQSCTVEGVLVLYGVVVASLDKR